MRARPKDPAVPTGADRPATDRLALIAALLAAGFGLIHVLLYFGWSIRKAAGPVVRDWFSLTRDYSLPSWFGFACQGMAAWTCWRWGRRGGRGGLVCAVLFLTLLMDDSTMFHERVGGWLADSVANTRVYAWVMVMGPLLAVLGLWAGLRLVAGMPTRGGRWLVLLGFACLGTALLLEASELAIDSSGVRLRGLPLRIYQQWTEEMLEFAGPILVSWTVGRAPSGASVRPERRSA